MQSSAELTRRFVRGVKKTHHCIRPGMSHTLDSLRCFLKGILNFVVWFSGELKFRFMIWLNMETQNLSEVFSYFNEQTLIDSGLRDSGLFPLSVDYQRPSFER